MEVLTIVLHIVEYIEMGTHKRPHGITHGCSLLFWLLIQRCLLDSIYTQLFKTRVRTRMWSHVLWSNRVQRLKINIRINNVHWDIELGKEFCMINVYIHYIIDTYIYNVYITVSHLARVVLITYFYTCNIMVIYIFQIIHTIFMLIITWHNC